MHFSNKMKYTFGDPGTFPDRVRIIAVQWAFSLRVIAWLTFTKLYLHVFERGRSGSIDAQILLQFSQNWEEAKLRNILLLLLLCSWACNRRSIKQQVRARSLLVWNCPNCNPQFPKSFLPYLSSGRQGSFKKKWRIDISSMFFLFFSPSLWSPMTWCFAQL